MNKKRKKPATGKNTGKTTGKRPVKKKAPARASQPAARPPKPPVVDHGTEGAERRPPFHAARTVAEADRFARLTLGIPTVAYGTGLAAANYANEALYHLQGLAVGMPKSVALDPRPFQLAGNEESGLAAYVHDSPQLGLRRALVLNREFGAEVFAMKVAGVNVPSKVQSLYRKLGGPELEGSVA